MEYLLHLYHFLFSLFGKKESGMLKLKKIQLQLSRQSQERKAMSSLVNQVSSSSMFEEEKAFGYALCLRFSNMFSYVLDAAIQLGIFAILAKASPDAHLSSYEIASQLHTTNNFSSYDPQLPHANLNPASHRLMRPCNSRSAT